MTIDFLYIFFILISLLIYWFSLFIVKKEVSFWTNKKIAQKTCKPKFIWIVICIIFSIFYFIFWKYDPFFNHTNKNVLTPVEFGFLCFWVAFHISLAQIDFFLKLLPYRLTILLNVMGLIFNSFFGKLGFFYSLFSGILAFTLLYGISKTIEFLKKNKSPPIGFGDFLYISSIGIWVGFYNLMFVLFFASLSMIMIFFFFNKSLNWKKNTPIPFGPSLSISSLLFGGIYFFNSGEMIL